MIIPNNNNYIYIYIYNYYHNLPWDLDPMNSQVHKFDDILENTMFSGKHDVFDFAGFLGFLPLGKISSKA